jgi:hypothetical protein
MSSDNKWGEILKAAIEMPRKFIAYITSAAARTFSPDDDNYPATGVQPFEGEINEEK